MTKVLADRWTRTLLKRQKSELIRAIVEMACADRSIMREVELRFRLDAPPKDLVTATHQAIADATAFNEREINSNFDYDCQAYRYIKCSFSHLIDTGHLHEAMELSLELMSKGSYQVEVSDEGLMTNDIEECLGVVFHALTNCDLPLPKIIAWCEMMTSKDRVGFICDKELRALRKRHGSL